MNLGWPLHPQRRVRVLLVVGVLAIMYAFLSGPSGLVSILIRRERLRRLQSEVTVMKKRIERKKAEERWLANPDSARKLARFLLDPALDSVLPADSQ